MDQFDLFNIEEKTSSNNDELQMYNDDIAGTKVKCSVTEAPTFVKKTTTHYLGNNIPNILLFATQHQRQMWGTFKHRRDCMMQVARFASFKDFGAKPMDQLTAKDCREYSAYLQDHTDLTDSTINRHLSAVSACLRYAVEELEIMDDRPKVGLLKAKKPNTRAFSKEMVDEMVSRLRDTPGADWVADMIIIGVKTGMRQGEITSLGLDSVIWYKDTKEIWLPHEITKTGEGRMVSLAAKDAWETAQRLKACIGTKFTHKRFYNFWWDLKHDMGYGGQDWFKFHATRHTAATNMAKSKNTTALTVAEQLGHSSLATTKKYYHGDADARAAAVADL